MTLTIEDRCAPTLIERVMRDVEPYLERAAAHIAAKFPAAAADMVQEARITLWELDVGRFARQDAGILRRILRSRMIQVYYVEASGGLTGEASQVAWAPLEQDRGD